MFSNHWVFVACYGGNNDDKIITLFPDLTKLLPLEITRFVPQKTPVKCPTVRPLLPKSCPVILLVCNVAESENIITLQ